MKIDFRTLKMMELRSSPGEVLDRVARDGDVFVVERSGQPLACLVPVSFLLPDISPERIAQELAKLEQRGEKYTLTITDKKELEISYEDIAVGDKVAVSVVLPHGYPNAAPRTYVVPLIPGTPHLWPDGSLSIFGATAMWNPKSHDVLHALSLVRVWLKQYALWRKSGKWPQRVGNIS